MIKDFQDTVSEIHMNHDADCHVTALLLKIHETSVSDGDGCESKHTGTGRQAFCCWSLPQQSSRTSVGKVPYPGEGDHMFPSYVDSSDFFSEKKQGKRNEEKRSVDFALSANSCINRKTFSYLPGNGCYKKHKRLVQRQLQKSSGKRDVAQEQGDDCDPQTLIEFQIYLSRLVPLEILNAGDGFNKTLQVPENSIKTENEKPNLIVQKSLSANVMGTRIQAKRNLTDVPTYQSNSLCNRPSSFHGIVSAFSISKSRQENAQDFLPATADVDFEWRKKDGLRTMNKNTDNDVFEFESHVTLEREIMKEIKETKKNTTRSGFSSETNKTGGVSLVHANDSTGGKKMKKSRVSSQYISDSINEAGSNVQMAQCPVKRNPFVCKPKVYHLSSLVTGPCFGPHQATLPKTSLPEFGYRTSTVNSIVRSSSRSSLSPHVAGNSFGTILEGRKIKTKKPNHRFL